MPRKQIAALTASLKESGQMHEAGDKKFGVMICGHGSRSKSAVTEFAVLAEKLAPLFPD